jgi:para-nitrobenzyl esterase
MATLFKRGLPSRLCKCVQKSKLRTCLKLGVALSACMFLAPVPSYAQGKSSGGPIVTTTAGKVQGFVVNGVSEFLGVPYAAPPLGNLRWRPPVVHASWSGVRQANAYAPICAQISLGGSFSGPANNNEDCLYLNVFTPLPKAGQKLPVLFWIHGGGDYDGETPGYDGSKLALQGHTVVVSVAYRLNLFGFLAIPSLDNEGHLFGNYGILDQQLALHWVHDNIAKFGGNPNNVTVGGQSAGAQDTTINIISPLAKGLFQHGICMSACSVNFTTLPTALSRGEAFAAAAGCGTQTGSAQAACLRALPAATVEALAGNGITYTTQPGAPGATSTGFTEDTGNSPYVVNDGMLDGTIVPIQPIVAWHTGTFNKPMTIMNGRTRDEETFLIAPLEMFEQPRVPLTAAQYESAINTAYTPAPAPPGIPYPAGTAAAILAHYPVSAYPSAELAWDAAETDPDHCIDAHVDDLLASQVPVYQYSFDDRTAPSYYPPMPGFTFWAYHTSDIQYVFPGFSGGPLGIPHPLNRLQTLLSDELVAAWTNFANVGNPNGVGNTPWPRYTTTRKQTLSENVSALTTYTKADYARLHQCAFWDTILPYTYGPAY